MGNSSNGMLAALQLRSGHKLSRKTYLWQFSRDELCYFPLRQFYPCCGIVNIFLPDTDIFFWSIYILLLQAGGRWSGRSARCSGCWWSASPSPSSGSHSTTSTRGRSGGRSSCWSAPGRRPPPALSPPRSIELQTNLQKRPLADSGYFRYHI